MHVVTFALLAVKLGSLLSCGIAALTISVLHGFGRRDSYHYGVWTIPDALVVDLGSVTFMITAVVWTVLGSTFILCFRLPPTWKLHIAPYSVPPSLRTAGKNLSYTLLHTPVFQVLDGKWRFSLRAAQLMIAKTLLLWIAMFAFITMPTCTVVTVIREQTLHKLSLKNRAIVTPRTCSQMFPDQTESWAEADVSHYDPKSKTFESLCWKYPAIFKFAITYGSVYGVFLSGLAVFTVAVQFGRSYKSGSI